MQVSKIISEISGKTAKKGAVDLPAKMIQLQRTAFDTFSKNVNSLETFVQDVPSIASSSKNASACIEKLGQAVKTIIK